ncbi:hypothetical protein MRY82_10425 [bacterium]|nr:hypothetical protein [bacterium]
MIVYQTLFLGLTVLVALTSLLLFETELGLSLDWSLKNLAGLLIIINFILLLVGLFKDVKQNKRSLGRAFLLSMVTGFIFSVAQAMLALGYASLYNGFFSLGQQTPLIGKIIKKERSLVSNKNGENYQYTMSIKTDERIVQFNVSSQQWNRVKLSKRYNSKMYKGALGFYYKKNF